MSAILVPPPPPIMKFLKWHNFCLRHVNRPRPILMPFSYADLEILELSPYIAAYSAEKYTLMEKGEGRPDNAFKIPTL